MNNWLQHLDDGSLDPLIDNFQTDCYGFVYKITNLETGKFYDFNRIPTELGKEITLNRVLLINNEGNVLIGQPYLENVKIQGKILQTISLCFTGTPHL